MNQEKKELNSKKIIKILGNIMTVLAFVFIIKGIMSFDIDYTYYLNSTSILKLLGFLFLAIVAVFFVYFAWHLILEFLFQGKIPYSKTMVVYFKSNLGKYLPGNIMQFAGRNLLGTNLGLTQTQIAMSSVIEIAILCITCLFWALILGYDSFVILIQKYIGKITFKTIIIIAIIVIAVAIIAMTIVYKKFKSFFIEIKNIFNIHLIGLIIKTFIMFSINMLINGSVLTLIVGFSTQITMNYFLLITTGYIISWIVGFIIPGAPGGIGVREAALTLIVGSVLGNGVVLSAAVVQRFLLILADVFSYLASVFIEKMIKNKKPVPE